MSPTTTVAPSSASPLAIPAPIPPAPATTMTFPSSLKPISLILIVSLDRVLQPPMDPNLLVAAAKARPRVARRPTVAQPARLQSDACQFVSSRRRCQGEDARRRRDPDSIAVAPGLDHAAREAEPGTAPESGSS